MELLLERLERTPRYRLPWERLVAAKGFLRKRG